MPVFEELPFRNYRLRYHTRRQVRISKELSLGVVSQRVTVNDALVLYEKLLKSGQWQQPCCPELQVAKLTPLEPVFVPCTSGIPIHSVLKNPYRFSNYFFEFFSEQKEFYQELNPGYVRGDITSLERKIYSAVQNTIPIDLEFIGDRWENIIFQLPVNLLKVDAWGERDGKHIWVATRWHPKLHCRREVRVEACAVFDQTILGRAALTTLEPLVRLPIGTSAGEITVRISDRNGEITLYEKSFHIINQVQICARLMHPEKITINVPPYGKHRPGFSYTVQPVSGDVVMAGAFSDWRMWVDKRINLASKRALEKRLEFVQYGVGGRNEWAKALSDLRRLITWHGENGVYLWDPYATANDILATFFACQFSGASLKVITSYGKQVRSVAAANGIVVRNYHDWVAQFKNGLAEALKQRKVNLEVRCQHGQYGWRFHDRFLLFPGREPKVWSLGCSVNALGLSHSILMKVAHPRPVLDAFESLWEALAQCVVWP